MPNPKIFINKGNTKSRKQRNNGNLLRKQTIKKQAIKIHIERPVLLKIDPLKLPIFIKKHIQNMKIQSESKRSPLYKSKNHLQVPKRNLTLKAKRQAKKKGRFLVRNFGMHSELSVPKTSSKQSIKKTQLGIPNHVQKLEKRPPSKKK